MELTSLLLGLLITVGTGQDQETVSPVNDCPLPAIEPTQAYSFWVAGHIYGSHGNRTSVFPAASFLANLEQFKQSDAALMVLLGDNFRRPDSLQIDQFQQLMRTLPFPVFNAPGNHDRPGSELYQRSFGSQTYLQFRLGRSMFIVLDTQLDQGRISGPQQEWLLQWLQRARDDESIDNVFVFGHQLVWCVDHSLLSTIRPHINSKKYLHAGWFQAEVMPDLQQLAGQKGVYWFAGDIGATWSYSTFYWKQPDSRLHFVATGLGDTARDAVLRVDVAGNGHVTIVPVSLTAQEMLPIEAYGPEFWEVYFARQRALAELVAKSAQALPATTTPAVRRSLARVWMVITAAVLAGCVIGWIAFRLVQSGWNRFKRLRIKYYSSSNRRVE